ncbi:MAG TPA: peptidylprolyl isomerase [Polyangiaceae bacterium]|nr:peptidylprolyl isomerase [Polyangiaceae bacterium]
MRTRHVWPWFVVLAASTTIGCEDKQAAPAAPSAAVSASAAPAASASAETPKPKPAPDIDPFYGRFTLEDATKGLEGSGKLIAEIETTSGKLTCTLFDDKAPLTVANFVGLARGTRPFKDDTGKWVKDVPAFDGSSFHRVIGKFMIQGGCYKSDCEKASNAGYFFQDEIWEGMTHDRAGQLCMANSGRNTNSMQFFITDAKNAFLDKAGHTIFGECKPLATVHKIATVPTDKKDKPKTPQEIKKVTIKRAGK